MDLSCLPGICSVSTVRKSSLSGYIINPLFTEFVQSRWLDIGLFFFAFLLTSTSSQSIKNAISNHLDHTLGQ